MHAAAMNHVLLRAQVGMYGGGRASVVVGYLSSVMGNDGEGTVRERSAREDANRYCCDVTVNRRR